MLWPYSWYISGKKKLSCSFFKFCFAVIRNSDMMFVIDQTALPPMPTGVSPAAAIICVCCFALFWCLLVILMTLGISVISLSFQKDHPAEMRAGGLLMVCLLNPVAWLAMDSSVNLPLCGITRSVIWWWILIRLITVNLWITVIVIKHSLVIPPWNFSFLQFWKWIGKKRLSYYIVHLSQSRSSIYCCTCSFLLLTNWIDE